MELLTPDFLGVEEEALQTVLGARPEVFSHNIETVRRLHRSMRGAKASYDGALHLLRRAKEVADYPVLTKTGIIAGLGETNEEIVDTMGELRAHGVDVVTIGQYLQPSAKHVRSTAGSIPTSSAGSASRARRSGSARCSPARSSARAIAPTSRSTLPTRASASSRTDRAPDEPLGASGCRYELEVHITKRRSGHAHRADRQAAKHRPAERSGTTSVPPQPTERTALDVGRSRPGHPAEAAQQTPV